MLHYIYMWASRATVSIAIRRVPLIRRCKLHDRYLIYDKHQFHTSILFLQSPKNNKKQEVDHNRSPTQPIFSLLSLVTLAYSSKTLKT